MPRDPDQSLPVPKAQGWHHELCTANPPQRKVVKVLIHEYSGHAFSIQLSRELSQRGFDVVYAFSKDITTPKGFVPSQSIGSSSLEVFGVSMGEPLAKYHVVKRLLQERKFANVLSRRMREWKPDVVISGNSPPSIQRHLRKAANRMDARFIYWLHDIYAIPLARHLGARFGTRIEAVVRPFLESFEYGQIARSDAAVVISEEFRDLLVNRGVDAKGVFLIPNWAPLNEIPLLPRINEWGRGNLDQSRFTFLYSGTLGMKHDPSLLLDLARSQPDATVVVISEGIGRDWLEQEMALDDPGNLRLLDYQPHDRFAQVLACSDVLVAILEPYASGMSVPSKVLSYLCAGRPVLSSIPHGNAARRVLHQAGAGINVAPSDREAFLDAARALREDQELRDRMGVNGREFAEQTFDMARIAGHFELVIQHVCNGPNQAGQPVSQVTQP